MWGACVQVCPIELNQDGFAIDCVLREELTMPILELSDLRWIQDPDFAVRPIKSPLVGLWVIYTQGQAFDVPGWAVDFDLVDTGAIVNPAADTGAVEFHPCSRTG